jgi:UV excision repair protein RAD23
MKLIVKTLNGKQLPLEIQADWTLRQVKDQIEKDHDLKADSLKIVHYGKVLDGDDKQASSFNLKEGDCIVAMVTKAKPAPKAKAEEKKEEEPV